MSYFPLILELMHSFETDKKIFPTYIQDWFLPLLEGSEPCCMSNEMHYSKDLEGPKWFVEEQQ